MYKYVNVPILTQVRSRYGTELRISNGGRSVEILELLPVTADSVRHLLFLLRSRSSAHWLVESIWTKLPEGGKFKREGSLKPWQAGRIQCTVLMDNYGKLVLQKQNKIITKYFLI